MIQTIYILWFDGFQNAPDVVKKCVDSWKYYNPDWNIILLDEDNYRQYVNLDKHLDITKKIYHSLSYPISSEVYSWKNTAEFGSMQRLFVTGP